MMKVFIPMTLVIGFASPALAWEGKVEKCFRKDYQAAQYSATKRKLNDEKFAYEHAGKDHVNLVRYPAMYVEELKKVQDDHYVLREVACKKK